jgi:molybdopterin adenylyltransferase
LAFRLRASAGSKRCESGPNERTAKDCTRIAILSFFPYSGELAFTNTTYNREMRAAVITVSDSSFRGDRVDVSGRVVSELLQASGFEVISHLVIPDEQKEIEDALRQQSEVARLIVTTGGTGVAPRDVTPEATRAVCDRLLDGFSELMRAEGRKQTQFADLSRSLAGIRRQALIVNVPGSPRGARSSLEAVLPLIPHTLTLIAGIATQHEDQIKIGSEFEETPPTF